MQVYEGSSLTFDIPAIFRDLDYDLVKQLLDNIEMIGDLLI
jgi:hypothetical protein